MSWLLERKSHLTPKVSGELRVLSYQQLMREMETKQKVFLKKSHPDNETKGRYLVLASPFQG